MWRDETTPPPPPPPPPPEVDAEDLSGGWAAHVGRWRGWQAPPRRPRADDATEDVRELPLTGEPPALPGVGALPPAPTLAPLLATARALPPLDWAPLLALAQADATRRQALVQAAEEEEMLVLLMLLEEV